MGYGLNYKTIDTLSAEVPSDDGDKNAEFIVRFGRKAGRRSGGPRLGDEESDSAEFVIENVALSIKVSDSTYQGARKKLREALKKKENFSGVWTLWMHVEATGNYEKSGGYNTSEKGHATIETSFKLELVTKTKDVERVRHMSYDKELPTPFTGEFWTPSTHAEHQPLREGPAFQRMVEDWVDDGPAPGYGRLNRRKVLEENPSVWVEATTDNVETIRALQQRLGEMGQKVEEALAKKNFAKTLEAVRKGGGLLLGTGAK